MFHVQLGWAFCKTETSLFYIQTMVMNFPILPSQYPSLAPLTRPRRRPVRRHVQLAPAFPRVGWGRWGGGCIFATVSEGEENGGSKGVFRVDYPSRPSVVLFSMVLHDECCFILHSLHICSFYCSLPSYCTIQSNRPAILLFHRSEREMPSWLVAINTRMSAQESAG